MIQFLLLHVMLEKDKYTSPKYSKKAMLGISREK